MLCDMKAASHFTEELFSHYTHILTDSHKAVTRFPLCLYKHSVVQTLIPTSSYITTTASRFYRMLLLNT